MNEKLFIHKFPEYSKALEIISIKKCEKSQTSNKNI